MEKQLSFLTAVISSFLLAVPCLFSCSSGPATSSEEEKIITVKFKSLDSISIFPIEDKELSEPKKIIPPTVTIKDPSTNPDNKGVSGWYTDAALFNKWDFKTMVVTKDMTLYAKWDRQFKVSYYLDRSFDDSGEALGAETYFEGEEFIDRSDLYDGYSFEGYYTSKTFDPATKIDLSKSNPVSSNFDVYIKRSKEIYFTPAALGNRFDNAVAAAGSGSTEPVVEVVEDDGDFPYYQVNFGYSTSGDPYVYSMNPTFDIDHTKKIEVKFRNLGHADNLKFYWTAKDKFNHFTSGASAYSENTCFTYKYDHDTEWDMTEWKTVTMDISSTVMNGYSTWGAANQLVKLRIQNTYVSKDKTDYSNILQIAYIKGIDSTDYARPEDGAKIKAMLTDDDPSDLASAKAAQSSITGFVFPKNYDCIDSTVGQDSGDTFDKVPGLLLHSTYGEETVKRQFNIGEGTLPVNLDELTTIYVKMKNFGYIDKLTLTIENESYGICSSEIGLSLLNTEQDDFVTYELNMFSSDYFYSGNLRSISLSFETTGVNNALLIERIEFAAYKPLYIHGVNFNELNCNGIKSTEDLVVTYDKGSTSTFFVVNEDGASFTLNDFPLFGFEGYGLLSLSFLQTSKDCAISAIKVDIETEEEGTDKYEFEIAYSRSSQTIDKELLNTGHLKSIKVTFVGTGTIRLKSLSFKVNDTSIDFSSPTYFKKMMSGQWYYGESFSAPYSALSVGNGKSLYCYTGGDGNTGLVNFPLNGKTKLILTYQNHSKDEKVYIGMGCGPKSEDPDDRVNGHYIGSSSGGSDYHELPLKTLMKDDEWESVSLNLEDMFTSWPRVDHVCTLIALLGNNGANLPTMFIRSIIIA